MVEQGKVGPVLMTFMFLVSISPKINAGLAFIIHLAIIGNSILRKLQTIFYKNSISMLLGNANLGNSMTQTLLAQKCDFSLVAYTG